MNYKGYKELPCHSSFSKTFWLTIIISKQVKYFPCSIYLLAFVPYNFVKESRVCDSYISFVFSSLWIKFSCPKLLIVYKQKSMRFNIHRVVPLEKRSLVCFPIRIRKKWFWLHDFILCLLRTAWKFTRPTYEPPLWNTSYYYQFKLEILWRPRPFLDAVTPQAFHVNYVVNLIWYAKSTSYTFISFFLFNIWLIDCLLP